MERRPSSKSREARTPEPARVFARMADAGSRCYLRERDLPKLIALWPREVEDRTLPGSLLIVGKLRRALRAERNRARRGHWSYDLNRHLALLSAYRAERALLEATAGRLKRSAPVAATPSCPSEQEQDSA